MPKVVRYIFYILALVLPLQTLLIQFLVNRLGLPSYISFWKEGLVFILILFFLYDLGTDVIKNRRSVNVSRMLPLILILLSTILISFNGIGKVSLGLFLTGFRFELWWLWFFAVMATWLNVKHYTNSFQQKNNLKEFASHFNKFILFGYCICCIFTICLLIFGQSKVLSSVGFGQYSGNLIIAPTSNLIDYGESKERLSGPFSTPNHFAGYLLLVLPILIINFLDTRIIYKSNASNMKMILLFVGIVSNVLFIILSVSRFAWLGLFMIFSFTLIKLLHQKFKKIKVLSLIYKPLLIFSILVPFFVGLLVINLPPDQFRGLPTFLGKPSSTTFHYRRTNASLEILATDKTAFWSGFGLGTSGSAAKPEYQNMNDNNIVQKHFNLGLKWYLEPLVDLAVPENWFLQVILNGGIVYGLIYILLILIPVKKLAGLLLFSTTEINWTDAFAGLAFLSIIIGNLFLHIWENQTISLYWSFLYLWYILSKSKSNDNKQGVISDSSF